MKQLTEDQFDAQFTVVTGADGDDVRPTLRGIDPDSKHLWTIIDAEGNLYAVSGAHYINRVGYIVTKEAWTEEIEAVWHIFADDEEDAAAEGGDA